MKLTLIVATVLSFLISVEDAVDRLGLKGPLSFNNTSFELAWTDKPNNNYYVQEYIPNNEQIEKFNQMLTIHLFTSQVTPDIAVRQKVNWLIDRKKTDKICNYKISESPDGKEFILDFLIGESSEGKMTIAEFNVYRYKQILIDGKSALLVSAYSRRSYGDTITSFLTTLNTNRATYLNEMITFSLPSLKVAN
jgi:hypothetical protein